MKQLISRALSVLLVITFVVSSFACFSITASAASYVAGANGVSASYKAGKYYTHHQSIALTGDNVTDVLAMAISQLGYQEGNSDGSFAGTASGGTGNFTEYNYNMGKIAGSYGGSTYAWCASFVSWCLLQGGATNQTTQSAWCRSHQGDINYIWREVSCAQWFNQLERVGYGKLRGTYTPESGDLIFFWNGSRISHIGIVLYCEGGRVYTIEGNTSSGSTLDSNGGGVYFKNYALTSTYIHGYGDMPYKSNPSVTKIDYSGKNPTTGLYMSATNKYLYASEAQATEGNSDRVATLPKYTMFNVTEVCSNGSLQISYNGDTYYVLNNSSDRVIQLSNSSNTGSSSGSSASLVKSCVDTHTIGGVDSTGNIMINAGQSVGLRGWAGYTVAIAQYGYYFDGNSGSTTWTTNPGSTTEDAVIALGGNHAKRYHIQANTSSLSTGAHTITFVVQLSDGSVQELHTLSARVTAAASVTTEAVTEVPTEAPTEAITEAPTEAITEAPTEAMTEAPTEPVTEAATEVVTEVTTEDVTEEVTEAATESATEAATEALAEPSTESEDITTAPEGTTAEPQDTAVESDGAAVESQEATTSSDEQVQNSSLLGSCTSSISALSMILVLPAALFMLKKKKED